MNNKLRRFVVKRKVLIGIVILVIVAIIVGIIAIRNNNSKENTKEEKLMKLHVQYSMHHNM